VRFHVPQPSAHTLRKAHFWLLILWLVMVPVAIATGLLESVAFVAAASIYANAAAHWAAWQGSRAEEEAE
jgi:hypothetical protein